MDMKMPVMTGYEAVKILKGDPATSGIPIITVSASTMTSEEDIIKGTGCDSFLRKPVTRNVFISEVARFLPHGRRPAGGAAKEVPGGTGIVLPAGSAGRAADLVREMEGMRDRWERLKKTFIINEIKDFASAAKAVGSEYSVGAIEEWGDVLYGQAESFDMERLTITLGGFEGLIGEVRKAAARRGGG